MRLLDVIRIDATERSLIVTRKAVIVVDMLNDFVTGELANPRSEAIIASIAALLAAARSQGWLVVYGNDAHLPGDPEEAVWGPHAMAGTHGAEVVPDLVPQDADIVLPKRFYSSFHETGLDSILRQNDVDEVILTGQHTNICVRHTASDAFNAGFRITVPEDGVAMFEEPGMTDDEYDRAQADALAYLAKVYGARIVETDKVLAEISTR
jgi:nicotinamidase-related amidase